MRAVMSRREAQDLARLRRMARGQDEWHRRIKEAPAKRAGKSGDLEFCVWLVLGLTLMTIAIAFK